MPKETKSRWSEGRFTNLEVPSYVPSEALLHEQGQYIRAVLLRAAANDMQRMLSSNTCDEYFRNMTLIPEYDASGNRTNTPESVIGEKRLRIMDELGKLLHTYVEQAETAALRKNNIERRIYFTAEQLENSFHTALIGPRGLTHKELEKETNCRIVLVGRGITNPLKDTNPNAASMALEEPHVRVTATNEDELQKAMEKIEWILSDDPEAVAFREKNRQRTAKVEGRYDPRTWVSAADKAKDAAGNSQKGAKRGRQEAEEEHQDAELEEFLEDL